MIRNFATEMVCLIILENRVPHLSVRPEGIWIFSVWEEQSARETSKLKCNSCVREDGLQATWWDSKGKVIFLIVSCYVHYQHETAAAFHVKRQLLWCKGSNLFSPSMLLQGCTGQSVINSSYSARDLSNYCTD